MFLDKVKSLDQIKIGKNQVLVELVYKRHQGNIKIVSSIDAEESSTSELLKMEVTVSNFEDVKVGDLVVDGRISMGQNGLLKLGDRTFAVMMGHDIKVWTSPDNYDENKQPVKKESLIKEASQGIPKSDVIKMEAAARGLNSKYLNNK